MNDVEYARRKCHPQWRRNRMKSIWINNCFRPPPPHLHIFINKSPPFGIGRLKVIHSLKITLYHKHKIIAEYGKRACHLWTYQIQTFFFSINTSHVNTAPVNARPSLNEGFYWLPFRCYHKLNAVNIESGVCFWLYLLVCNKMPTYIAF